MNRIAKAIPLLLLVAGGCTTQGLAFVQDRRVEIVEPGGRERVDLPVRVAWEVTDDNLRTELQSGTRFGVYVDVDPQPPGQPLEYFARDDKRCQASSTCPDERYFRQRGIHTTTATEITFPTLAIAPGVDLDRGDPDFHEMTIVLLDDEGVRIGESAWSITFEVERPGQG
jgi:hypothetical protein